MLILHAALLEGRLYVWGEAPPPAPSAGKARRNRVPPAALRLAAALAAREQFLPGVEKDEGGWRACWKPALHGNDEPRYARLAQAMPGAARALGHSADAPPDTAAATVLRMFPTLVLDELVR